MHKVIQEKWIEGYLPGFDAIIYGDGSFVIANACRVFNPNDGTTKHYWSPFCDTTFEQILKYDDDIWTAVDVFHGSFEYEEQRFVFGDGGMGNEGYIACTTLEGKLNWAIFFTFSNPIIRAEVIDRQLICYGDSGIIIEIDLDLITNISVTKID